MDKVIDLNKSVYEIVTEYPELKEVMAGLGFSEITKKAMLHSVAKIMTIPKGAAMKNIPMDKIIDAFNAAGFEVAGENNSSPVGEAASEKKTAQVTSTVDDRNKLLKSYLKRLGDGEDLESVRADFTANFADVDPSEIMKAEQELIAEGTPITEVQKLCDVHSALFHGATREEQIANAEKAAMESLRKNRTHYDEKLAKTEAEYKAALEKQQRLHESVPKDRYDNKQTA